MHKGNFKKNSRTFKIGLSEIYKLQPWILPVTITDALFKSIVPFINIYMSARIIDELLGLKNIDKLIFLVVTTISLNFIIHLISTALEHLLIMLKSVMEHNQQMALNEKIINMDYEHVENPEVHSLRTKISESQTLCGGGVYALIESLGQFVKGFATVYVW